MDCHCGSGKKLDACCGPYLDGTEHAPTAEALMRSRYSAYVAENIDYVVETHHPDTRKDVDPNEVREWAATSDWLGLEIVATDGGGPKDDEGTVEFIARWEDERERVKSHHERSVFKRQGGRWYFYDGEVMKGATVVRGSPKIGRNDPCHCGSGKKFKKCHGRAA